MSTFRFLGSIAALTLSVAASAQAYQPRHEALLKRALAAITAGQCAPEMMTPVLQYQCETNLQAMVQHFSGLGPIAEVTFRGTQQSPSGPVEVYLVKYGRGQMLWMVATDPDGKLTVLWSPG